MHGAKLLRKQKKRTYIIGRGWMGEKPNICVQGFISRVSVEGERDLKHLVWKNRAECVQNPGSVTPALLGY